MKTSQLIGLLLLGGAGVGAYLYLKNKKSATLPVIPTSTNPSGVQYGVVTNLYTGGTSQSTLSSFGTPSPNAYFNIAITPVPYATGTSWYSDANLTIPYPDGYYVVNNTGTSIDGTEVQIVNGVVGGTGLIQTTTGSASQAQAIGTVANIYSGGTQTSAVQAFSTAFPNAYFNPNTEVTPFNVGATWYVDNGFTTPYPSGLYAINNPSSSLNGTWFQISNGSLTATGILPNTIPMSTATTNALADGQTYLGQSIFGTAVSGTYQASTGSIVSNVSGTPYTLPLNQIATLYSWNGALAYGTPNNASGTTSPTTQVINGSQTVSNIPVY